MDDEVEPRDLPERLFPVITIEVVLYGALGLAGLSTRLLGLGDAPLAGDEAQQALASWNFVRGVSDAFTGSPFLFTGNALLFALFGATDAAARLLNALFGSALVLLPALLRRELGRVGALIAGMLLALSPSLVFFSRNANGTVIAVTCALAALIFAWRYLNEHAPRDLELGAMSAALALLAAREVWTVIIAVAFFTLAVRVRLMPPLVIPNADEMQRKRDLRRAAILFGVVFIGIATTLLLHREGVGAAFDLFGTWLDDLRPGLSLLQPLRLLVVYEPISLFLGVAAVIQLAFTRSSYERDQTPLGAFSLWFIVAFILYSIGGGKSAAHVVVLVIPLALLAGWYIGVWIERATEYVELQSLLWQETPVFLLACTLTVFVYILLAEFATRGTVLATEVLAAMVGIPSSAGVILAWLVLIAVAAIAFLAVTTLGWVRTGNVGLALLLTLLSAWTIRQMAILNFPVGGALNPQESVIVRAASPNVRDLVFDLEDISRWRAYDSLALTVVADESLGSIVEWNLRGFRNARFVAHPSVVEDIQALLLPSDAPVPAAGWIGQRYRLESGDTGEPVPNLLRWLLFRDIGTIAYTDVVLWMPATQE